ncbi:MAG: hypothetical protein ABSH09_24320 [Bryobacteraceae bacterium]|jgi:hypothetical protein
MRAYLLTFFSAATLFSAYGASWSGSYKAYQGTFNQGDTDDLYIIYAHNDGSNGTDALITITDTLPTGLMNPHWTGVPAGWTCTTTATTATCTTSVNGAIGAGDTVELYLLVDVSNTAPASVTNEVSFAGGGASNGFTYPDVTPINPEAYLTITKTQTNPAYKGNPLPVSSGQSLTDELTVDNIGGAPTSGMVTVVDTLSSDMVVGTVTNGAGFWTCHHTATVVTCTTTNVIAAGADAPNIFVTAAVLGTNASDTATVTYNGLTTSQTSTATVTSTVQGITNVTFTSNQSKVDVDGEVYGSGITIQENTALTHTVYAYPNCKIMSISGFSVTEMRPATPLPPWTEVTGLITGPIVAVDCL